MWRGLTPRVQEYIKGRPEKNSGDPVVKAGARDGWSGGDDRGHGFHLPVPMW